MHMPQHDTWRETSATHTCSYQGKQQQVENLGKEKKKKKKKKKGITRSSSKRATRRTGNRTVDGSNNMKGIDIKGDENNNLLVTALIFSHE